MKLAGGSKAPGPVVLTEEELAAEKMRVCIRAHILAFRNLQKQLKERKNKK